MKRLAFLALFALACVALIFPSQVRADLPYLTATGSLNNPGDVVRITGLNGQSSCSFYETGTPGATDVYGSPDNSSTTTNLTSVAVTDYANPPNVKSQPFTPTAGDAYIVTPSSFRQVIITADSTWSGSATVFIGCSSSVARAASGGGGGSVTGTEPITVTSNNVGFDYTFAGQFEADQTVGNGEALGNCSSISNIGLAISNYATQGFYFYDDGTPILHIGAYQVGGKDCSTYDTLTIDESGNLYFPAAGSPGCLYVSSPNNEVESDGSGNTTCGGATYTPGPNITFPSVGAGTPQPIALASVPIVSGIEFTPSPNYSPGTLAGFALAGDGNSQLVSVAVSPCPTAGGCVVSVSGSGGTTCTGTAIVNCSTQTPTPTCTGAVSCTGTLFDGNLVISAATASPAPTPYPTPVVSASPGPITVSSSVVAGATVYDLVFGILEPQFGGLGLNATSFSNGQCPQYSTSLSHFIAGTCGGGTYTAGTNISIASNVISTIAAPVFSGTVSSDSGGSSNQVSANNSTMAIISAAASGTDPLNCTNTNEVVISMCQVSTESEMHFAGIVGGSTVTCTFLYPGAAFDVSCPFDFTGNAPIITALTASKGVCSSSGKALVSCSSGQASCALSSSTSCTATATVTASSACSATYDHATTVTLADLTPLTIGLSGTTLSMYADTNTSLTGTIYIDYRC